MTTHYLKTWPEYFSRVLQGQKTFELRKNDRDFQVGDVLILQHYVPEDKAYGGDEIHVYVKYILHGPGFGIKKGYCVMSFEKIDKPA